MRALMLVSTLTVLLAGASAEAVPLSEVALYHRCFVRLTGEFPDYVDDPRLARVRAGEVTAVDACLEVLDLATPECTGQSGNDRRR